MNEGRDHPNSLEVRKFQPSRRRLTRDLPHFADGERVAPRVLGRTRTAAACWRGGRATRRARANHRAIAAGWHYRQAAPCIIRASAPPCRRSPVTGSSLCQERQCRLIFQGAQKSSRRMLRSSSASKRSSTEATCGRLHSRLAMSH